MTKRTPEQVDQLKADIDAFVDRVWPEVLDDIAALVRHRSVEELDQAAPGAPWGPGPRAALDEALAMAERYGLESHDCDGYLGYADLAGASDVQLATIAHVDVVPEGEGWHTDPFEMTRREGYLLGRGVIDDKGPFVLSLHAARFFAERAKATGEPLPYTLRVIIGANEETGMGDVDHYLEHNPQPAFLFTPDAEFPVCNGEKGQLFATFVSEPICFNAPGARIVRIEGGSAPNAVPGTASALVRCKEDELKPFTHISWEPAGKGLFRITATGKGGHASLPEGTINAIGRLALYLSKHRLCSPEELMFLRLENLIHMATDGSGIGIKASDQAFGALTVIGGTIETTKDGRIRQTVDIRYPKSTTAEKLALRLAQLAGDFHCDLTIDRAERPFYVEPDSPQIQTLVRCYNEYTGEDAKPFTIGGGTYARHFANAASFGPEDTKAELPEWVGHMHGPDEGVSEERLRLALKIYTYAIAELMELDLASMQQ